MVRDYVVTLLKNYNRLKSEREMLIFERTRLENMEVEETIEAMVFSYSQEERVTSGKVSDQTSTIALNYADQHRLTKEQMLSEVDSRLRWLGDTLSRLDFYIDQLEAHHASTLREHFIDGYSWTEMAGLRCISKTTLLKQKEIAITQLCGMYVLLGQMGLLNLHDTSSSATV